MPRLLRSSALAGWRDLPSCKSEKVYRLVKRDQFLCSSCEYQFSVTVDTIFHDTHLPLVTWFLATFLLCEAKKGMSALQIQRSLGIKTYKTAWYLCHRIRKAMLEDSTQETRRHRRDR